VVRELDVARLAQERGEIRGEEALALAEADDERALVPRADEQPRMVVVDDDEGEMALELAVGGRNGLRQVARVVPLHEVDDDLRVGLRAEDVALGDER